jgi:hypothetical protein
LTLITDDAIVDVSDELRNLILGHANSTPFQRHYLGREISADTWAIIRGLKPQQTLIKQATSIGHSISKRRPTGLTPDQSASILTHPRIKRLQQKLQTYRRGSADYKETSRELRNEKQNMRRACKQQIRVSWTIQQAVEDIEHQLQGFGFPEQVVDNSSCSPRRPAQEALIMALRAPPGNTAEEEFRRKGNAIAAVTAYCTVEEEPIRRFKQAATKPRTDIMSDLHDRSSELSTARSLERAAVSVFVKTIRERPKRCFLCIGKALALGHDDSAIEMLIHEFHTPGDLSKHFGRKHLANLQEGKSIVCQVCDLQLNDINHLKAHALLIHGIVSPEKRNTTAS